LSGGVEERVRLFEDGGDDDEWQQGLVGPLGPPGWRRPLALWVLWPGRVRPAPDL